ncbi:MAG TPA: 4-hydroxy-tetrahydrodipicolinate synthase [Solirubrobacteraceae bacterium]|jgi:4-hydroxy-tetrahydrodipicolinate synthase|nr:4-hydroxy-tetrahydrodipicolinate synthase [Solirubrobacteraceae bacterium]
MAELGKLLTAVITPFDADGRVDEEAFVRVLQHVCEHGSDGVVACGSTGEAATLSDEEHLRVVALAVENVPQGKTVIAGTGSNDTRHAVELTERATALGVDAVLSVTPYYNRPDPRGLVAHYTEVARATDRPILLYNIPSRTGLDIPNDLLARLGQIDGIVGVKQANDESLAPIDGLELYAGNDNTFARVLDLGGAGGILVASHVIGDLMRRLVDEPGRRAELDATLQPVYAALGVHNPIPVKKACELLGLCSARLRLPLVEADEERTAIVREALERVGVLAAA